MEVRGELRELAAAVDYRPCSGCRASGFSVAGEWAYGCAKCEPAVITLDVLGTPAPKGSSRAIMMGGLARNVPSGSDTNRRNLRAWDAAVREVALDQLGRDRKVPLWSGRPLGVEIVFRMLRKKGDYGVGKNAGRLKPGAPSHPWTKPDIDKLARTTLDSLTDLVYDDDSRIAKLSLEKQFAAPGHEGATIVVRAMT